MNIHGYNNTSQNRFLLTEISEVVNQYKNCYGTNLTLCGGDLNIAPDDWLDRSPSKFTNHHFNTLFLEFCNTNSLIDVWRNKNLMVKQFSWLKPNGSCTSRIDLWLSTLDIIEYVSEVSMSSAPLTDHCSIYLELKPKTNLNKRNTNWKFNADLLKSDDYCKKIKELLLEIKFDTAMGSYSNRWEFFKYKVRQISIEFGKQRSKEMREQELNLVQEIDECCKRTPMSDKDRSTFMILQSKLDDLYLKRAHSAFVRSRAKWTEEGEKNTAYFCSLEKRRQERNAVNVLMIYNIECTDHKLISEEVHILFWLIYLLVLQRKFS